MGFQINRLPVCDSVSLRHVCAAFFKPCLFCFYLRKPPAGCHMKKPPCRGLSIGAYVYYGYRGRTGNSPSDYPPPSFCPEVAPDGCGDSPRACRCRLERYAHFACSGAAPDVFFGKIVTACTSFGFSLNSCSHASPIYVVYCGSAV